jgi:hypothetical protein
MDVPLQLPRKLLIDITMQQTNQRSILLLWVCLQSFDDQLLHLLHQFSVLHPHHTLKYFEHAGWEPSWIKAAEEIVRALDYLSIPGEWNLLYLPLLTVATATSTDIEHVFSQGRVVLSHIRNRLSA